jgi:Antitoxin Phd_YefM, type II toxin-antitoxin system
VLQFVAQKRSAKKHGVIHAIHVLCMTRKSGEAGMIKVSAAEFQRNIGRYQDMALVQPVAVTRKGRERTVMISVEEYHRLKRRDRQVFGLEDFTDAHITALEAARAPDSSKAFDRELKSQARAAS